MQAVELPCQLNAKSYREGTKDLETQDVDIWADVEEAEFLNPKAILSSIKTLTILSWSVYLQEESCSFPEQLFLLITGSM